MRRIITFICLSAVILACLFGCVIYPESNYVPEYTPDGYVSHKKYLEKDRWMDVTDYYVYKYDVLPALSEGFKPLKPDENGKTEYTSILESWRAA